MRTLESRFKPGEYAVIVTADHGQCPLVDTAGGVRLDPIQLEEDISRAFGRSVFGLVEVVWPSEVYLNEKLVGYSIMEELPFEAELTHAAKPGGKNVK